MVTKLDSEVELWGNLWRTLVGEELDAEDCSASASGPPIEAIWFVAHPVAQLRWDSSLSLPWWPVASPSPVDSFKETSDDEFPGIEMERRVLALLAALLGSSSDLGQSSKKCLKMWPADLLLLSGLELQGTKEQKYYLEEENIEELSIICW